MISFPVNRHRIWQLLADALLIAAAWRLTFFLRFDQTIPPYYRHLLSWRVFVAVVAIKLSVFVLFGFYNRWWRYVSTRDMWGAARGVVAASPAPTISTSFPRATSPVCGRSINERASRREPATNASRRRRSRTAMRRGSRDVSDGGNAYSTRSVRSDAATTPRAAPHMSRVETYRHQRL